VCCTRPFESTSEYSELEGEGYRAFLQDRGLLNSSASDSILEQPDDDIIIVGLEGLELGERLQVAYVHNQQQQQDATYPACIGYDGLQAELLAWSHERHVSNWLLVGRRVSACATHIW
jgi:hypothetical protein